MIPNPDDKPVDRPVIGLTSRTLLLPAARQNRPTETVARSYVEPIEAAGGLALLLPNCDDPERAGAYLDRLDGLVLTGGDDPHPHLFGEEPHPGIEAVDERRDHFEIALSQQARTRGLPVLGLCRGVQLMNIAAGGDIYQDVVSQTESEVRHVQLRLDDGPWHKVEIRPGSLLGRVIGEGVRAVNSFHHQACRRVGDGLEICAKCPADGLIEALWDPEHPFFLGVQWHPELNAADGDTDAQRLFQAFVEAARAHAQKASK